MRVALVHDWLTGMRGGEKVLSLLCRLLPEAHLFTLLHVPGSCDAAIERMRIRTSWLDSLPGIGRYYRGLLPVMPLAVERLDTSDFDLVVSCSHCVAKGLVRSPRAAHVCYCFTPMRYLWAQSPAYRARMGPARLIWPLLDRYLRAWDRRSAAHVDLFLANSQNVARRIASAYRRDAAVVCSPIDADFYAPTGQPREDFYLMVTALAPYKRVDQAVEAFARLGRPLRIIGSGPLHRRLARSRPPNVQLLGWQSDETVREHYRTCRAFIFPGEEDFGLTPLEAMACGAPTIAYGAGGALETVLDRPDPANPLAPTGLLYTPQTVDALVQAVERFEQAPPFDPDRLARWARSFSHQRFLDEFRDAVRPLLHAKGLPEPWSKPTAN